MLSDRPSSASHNPAPKLADGAPDHDTHEGQLAVALGPRPVPQSAAPVSLPVLFDAADALLHECGVPKHAELETTQAFMSRWEAALTAEAAAHRVRLADFDRWAVAPLPHPCGC